MSLSKIRRRRPLESQFSREALANRWDSLAEKRSPGFAWDGSGYGSARTQAIDEASMDNYFEALKLLLEVAPTGFPAHKCLLETFELLHARHGILSCDSRFVLRAATLATENWRVMTKHIYNAALSNKKLTGRLQELVAIIKLPSQSSQESLQLDQASDEPGPSAAEMDAKAVENLFPQMQHEDGEPAATDMDSSDDDVIFCGEKCRCPMCCPTIQVDDDEAEAHDQLMAIPSAAIGGQKRETKANARGENKKGKGSKGKVGDKKTGEQRRRKQDKDSTGNRDVRFVRRRIRNKRGDIMEAEVPLPTERVLRKPTDKRRGEAYVLDSNGKYVVGVSSKRTDEYAELVHRVVAKFNDKSLKTKEDAKQWVEEQIA